MNSLADALDNLLFANTNADLAQNLEENNVSFASRYVLYG